MNPIEQMIQQAHELMNAGRWSEARDIYTGLAGMCMEAYQQAPNDNLILNFAYLSNMAGMASYQMGRYAEGATLFEQALEARRRVLGEEHPDTLTSLNNLALCLTTLGRAGEALPRYEQAYEVCCRVLGEEHPHTLTSLNNLAECLRVLGRAGEALPLHEKEWTICCRVLGEEHPSTLTSLNNLALCLRTLGRAGEALPRYEQAYEVCCRVLGEEHPDTLTSLNNLALCLRTLGRAGEALPRYEQAYEVCCRVLGEEHPDTLTSLNNLAGCLETLGRAGEALPRYEQALEARRRVLGEEHPDTLTSLNNLAGCLQTLGRAGEALPRYEQAYEVCCRVLGEEHPSTLTSLNNLAACLETLGRAGEALDRLLDSLEAEGRLFHRLRTLPEAIRRSQMGTFSATLPAAVSLTLAFSERSGEQLSRLYEAVVDRQRIENELQAAPQNAVLLERYPHLREHVEQRQALQTEIGNLALNNPFDNQENIRILEAQVQQIEHRLLPQIEELRTEMTATRRSGISLSLPPGCTLVEYLRYDRYDFQQREWAEARYAAFTLEQGEGGELRLIDLGEAEPIDQLIQTFRELARGRGPVRPEPNYPITGPIGKLAEKIWTPLRLGGKQRLLVVPDGEVGMVPFDLFPQAGIVTYLSATADLLTRSQRNKPAERLSEPLIVGDPNYHFGSTPLGPPASGGREGGSPESGGKAEESPESGRKAEESPESGGREEVNEEEVALLKDATSGLRRLPGSHLEARRVGRLLKQTPYLWDEALMSLVGNRRAPSLLFLSTHGFAVEDMALLGPVDPRTETGQTIKRLAVNLLDPLHHCGVAMAGASTYLQKRAPHPTAGDGFLTGYKITMLDLRGSDVILSACNTNAAVKRNGRGLLGLRSALFHAGAKSLILTLWPISDFATGPFMEELCRRRYHQHQSPLEALKASKEYLKNLTIGQMKQGYWLSKEAEQALHELRTTSEGHTNDQVAIDATLQEMHKLREMKDDHRPFNNPVFWAAFVLYGG